jgi:hypothetical protein
LTRIRITDNQAYKDFETWKQGTGLPTVQQCFKCTYYIYVEFLEYV